MRTKVFIYLLTLFISGIIFGYLLSQLIQGSLIPNLANVLTPLILLAVMVILWQDLSRGQRRASQPPVNSTDPATDNNSASVTPTGNTPIKGEILAKLTGDMTVAAELVEQAKRNYPGRTEEWYWQKVMDDLQNKQQK